MPTVNHARTAAKRWAIDLSIALAAGAILTLWFWKSLAFTDAGFLGGDIYNYYFPLRKLYADGLRDGTIYLWHPDIGNGIPILGESQTGAFYLPYLVAYRFLELADAYKAVFLIHYPFAFVNAFVLGRTLQRSRIASLFLATVFVFGWFPERACLEWAIVAGSWCPLATAVAIRFLQRPGAQMAAFTAMTLAMQLLVGHFQLAFVGIVGIAVLTASGFAMRPGWRTIRRGFALFIALAGGFAIAAPQIVPAWILKSRSQRQDDEFARSVDFGNVPLWYWAQMILPGEIYPQSEDLIRAHGATTNIVEAHLYPGRFTLLLLAAAPFVLLRNRGRTFAKSPLPWCMLLVVGLFLVEGRVFLLLNRLPGFGYFRYPGRYGMLVQLAAAVLAAMTLDRLWNPPYAKGMRRWAPSLAAFVALILTSFDFHWIRNIRGESRIGYAAIVPDQPIRHVNQSPIRPSPSAHSGRILAMDGNTLSLLGFACVPPYLGLGPVEYFQVWNSLPNVFRGEVDATPEIIALLRKMGVTHLLTEKPLPDNWPAQRLWSGYDPFLHVRWGRNPNEPLHLYKFTATWGRAYVVKEAGGAVLENEPAGVFVDPQRVQVSVSRNVNNAKVVLTDLDYPGWKAVRAESNAETPIERSFIFRSVPVGGGNLNVAFYYRDVGLNIGIGVFAAALAVLLIRLRRERFRRDWLGSIAKRKLH